MKRSYLLWFFAMVGGLAIGLSWSWLEGPASPLRHKELLAVEKWAEEILAASAEAELQDPFLLAGLVYAESRGKANAVSSVGALGLCQLMPDTAFEMARSITVVGPPYSARDNLRMGAHYLARMLQHRKDDVDLALLSYRLGPGRVSRNVKAAGGVEPYLDQLRQQPKSAWGYRDQVVLMRQRFAERAQSGVEAWSGWRVQ
ncbi:MAG: transglycosylase SLT domain-containing protein [Planctomycetes bacterium]|nr:transglycosylase SLT domain-containing protein [Planctomycetota bacterium]